MVLLLPHIVHHRCQLNLFALQRHIYTFLCIFLPIFTDIDNITKIILQRLAKLRDTRVRWQEDNHPLILGQLCLPKPDNLAKKLFNDLWIILLLHSKLYVCVSDFADEPNLYVLRICDMAYL